MQIDRLRRREFITLMGGAATWPLAVRAQQGQVSITKASVAFLGAESPSTNRHFVDAFRQGLREHGYTESQHVTIVERWAEGRSERFPELVSELIRQKVSVILAISVPAALPRRMGPPRSQLSSLRPIPSAWGSSLA